MRERAFRVRQDLTHQTGGAGLRGDDGEVRALHLAEKGVSKRAEVFR
jgi:hypothetical protein